MTAGEQLRVDFAFLCDAASAGEAGKLDAFGVGVDSFMATTLPALLPLLLVARLSGVDGPALLSVRALSPDGQPLMTRKVAGPIVRTPAGRPWKAPLLEHLFIPTAAAGDYRLDLIADGETIHSIAYWVEPPHAPEFE